MPPCFDLDIANGPGKNGPTARGGEVKLKRSRSQCGHCGCLCANASSMLPSLPSQAPWSQSARYSRCLRVCARTSEWHVKIHRGGNESQCAAVSVPRRLIGMLSSRRCMATPNGRRHRWISSISILYIQIHYTAKRAAQRASED